MGGEKGSRYREQVRALGSPPHGRGKDLSAQHPERGRRITPAWAGKRAGILAIQPGEQDHPRMGGEKLS